MISILIPLYNGVEYLNEAVTSVFLQTFESWELIIGVNGHPENSEVYTTAKKLEDISHKIRVFDFHQLKGKSVTLNEMVKFCKYDWICLLDADDKWLPTKLEKQLPYVSSYDVIGTQCRYFGDKDIIPEIPLGDISKFDFFKVNPIINSSCLIKKGYAKWNSHYDGVEDYDKWLQLRFSGKQFFNVAEVLVLHRIHKDSSFNAKGNNNKVPELLAKYKALSSIPGLR